MKRIRKFDKRSQTFLSLREYKRKYNNLTEQEAEREWYSITQVSEDQPNYNWIWFIILALVLVELGIHLIELFKSTYQ